jgi:hypothetical protein
MKYFFIVGTSGSPVFTNHPDPTLNPILGPSQAFLSENFGENVLYAHSQNNMRFVFQQVKFDCEK